MDEGGGAGGDPVDGAAVGVEADRALPPRSAWRSSMPATTAATPAAAGASEVAGAGQAGLAGQGPAGICAGRWQAAWLERRAAALDVHGVAEGTVSMSRDEGAVPTR